MTPSQARELYAYNRWANRRLLDAAADLPREALLRDLGASHGSVWGTLCHILWGEWLWFGRWLGMRTDAVGPLEFPDLVALRGGWQELERERHEFLEGLTPADLERAISYENPPGTRWTYTLGQMLQHVVNHSTYHRGQVAALLRQLGRVPPPTDYLIYFDELAADPGPGTAD